MIIIFVVFIDQLIDYPINRASFSYSPLKFDNGHFMSAL